MCLVLREESSPQLHEARIIITSILPERSLSLQVPHGAFNSQGQGSALLTRKPPGHADNQQDDRSHQQNGDECDDAVHPEGNIVCNLQRK